MDEAWRDALAALAAWHRAHAETLTRWPLTAAAHILAADLLDASSRR